jgi:hypothetical protein
VRKRIAQLLSICLLALTGNVSGIAQEVQSAAQATPTAATQEKRIAEAEKEKRAAAKAVEQQKRALAQQKRIEAQQKRTEARIASEQKRSLERAFRQAAHPEGTFKLLGFRLDPRHERVVTGAPYSATAITEHTQTLSDGNQIIQKNEATYYRDSEGRMRTEQKLKTIGKWTAAGDPPQIITIFDPVAGNFYSLDPRTRTALMDRGPQKAPRGPKEPSGPRPPRAPRGPKELSSPKELNDLKELKGPKEKPVPSVQKKSEPDQHVDVKEGSGRQRRKESLGTKTIEGVSAEGTRSTLTIPAGEIGNVGPIEIIDESWYSPELQVPLMTRHHDPRSGDSIYRLTNIKRSEPARSLFEVPADYRIVDKRAPKPAPEPRPQPPPKALAPAPKPE